MRRNPLTVPVCIVFLVAMLGGIISGAFSDNNVDHDGIVPWGIDLACKNVTRVLIGHETKAYVERPDGSVDSTVTFHEVGSEAVLDTIIVDISDTPGNRVRTTTRLVEVSVDGDTLWGNWNVLSEEVLYEPTTGGCSANRWLRF